VTTELPSVTAGHNVCTYPPPNCLPRPTRLYNIINRTECSKASKQSCINVCQTFPWLQLSSFRLCKCYGMLMNLLLCSIMSLIDYVSRDVMID